MAPPSLHRGRVNLGGRLPRPQHKTLLAQAKAVLDGNWTGHFTMPSPRLYPHQWNWDAAFIAIGLAHYRPARAAQELRALFAGQWQTGMVPQIVFNPQAARPYFPGPEFWQTRRAAAAPRKPETSGITMPPVHATAALHMYRTARNAARMRESFQALFPKLLASHRYFYRFRDPAHEGLVYIRHPWESGVDNSPTWDAVLCEIDLTRVALPDYQREDLATVSSEQRPTREDYDRYVYLVDLFRQCDYNDEEIFRTCPFLVQDPMFNSLLYKATNDLVELASILNQDAGECEEWLQQSYRSFNSKLWNAETRAYDAFDLVRGRRIPVQAVTGFLPLFGGLATPEQAAALYDGLRSPSFGGPDFARFFRFPSFDVRHKAFDPRKYWRGPVWVNVDWMLYHGLKSYGYKEGAEAVRRDVFELVERFGFYEYFTPYRESTVGGLGADRFSWTAALYLDLAGEKPISERNP